MGVQNFSLCFNSPGKRVCSARRPAPKTHRRRVNPEKQVLIEECVKNSILKEYLGRKPREVMNMLKEGVDVSLISNSTGLSPEVILKLQQEQ